MAIALPVVEFGKRGDRPHCYRACDRPAHSGYSGANTHEISDEL